MAKLKLRAITDGNDKNGYCGPSVISALTDLTTGEAARLIRKQHGRTTIKWTTTAEVFDALRACNIRVLTWQKPKAYLSLFAGKTYRFKGPTLAAWLKHSKEDRTPGRVFLISAGQHWQLVSGRRYTCGRVRDIVSIKDKRVKRRARVRDVYELQSDNVTKPDIDVSKPKDKYATARSKAKRIAKKIGVEIEVSRIGRDIDYDVSPPKSIEDPFEYESHICYDWNEVLDMVEVYEKLGVGVKITKDMAKSIAKTIDKAENPDWSSIRDHVDTATAGELDAFKLDLMTEWVVEEYHTVPGHDEAKIDGS